MTNNKLKFHAILRSLRHGETGGALVETALTLPLLVTLTLGSVELARVAYTSIEVANAAKAAVSYGAQNLTTVVGHDRDSDSGYRTMRPTSML